MSINRFTGMNTGFGMELFKSVDEAIRNENKSLMEQEKVGEKDIKEVEFGTEDYSHEEMLDWIADARERKEMGESNDEIWEYIVNETGNHYLADDVIASLPEGEQELADQPTDKDVENANKADKEAKKAEIEKKMESIIDAMHNTQIDSEEAQSLANEFQELQSELAKLELEEGELSIKEEYMKFAEDFCKESKRELYEFLNRRLDTLNNQIANSDPKENIERIENERESVMKQLDNLIAECPELEKKEECDKQDKELKEESYEDEVYKQIEEALENAGLNPTRFTDLGVMTKNIGWELGNGVQLVCEGTWIDEQDQSLIKDLKKEIAEDKELLKSVKGEAKSELHNDINDNERRLEKEQSKPLDECGDKDKITETEVKNIKPIKQQGNVFMLEDEEGKVIVGEDFNEEDGLIQNAEVYENKEEADKDYLERCNVVKTESEEVKECDEPLPDDETIGLPDFSPNEELNRKMAGKKVQADGTIVDGEGKEVTVDECDKPKKKLADYIKK